MPHPYWISLDKFADRQIDEIRKIIADGKEFNPRLWLAFFRDRPRRIKALEIEHVENMKEYVNRQLKFLSPDAYAFCSIANPLALIENGMIKHSGSLEYLMQYVSDRLEFKSREYTVDPINHVLNRVPGEAGDPDEFPPRSW